MAPKDMCFFMQIKISAYFFSFSKKLYTSHGMEIRTPNIMWMGSRNFKVSHQQSTGFHTQKE